MPEGVGERFLDDAVGGQVGPDATEGDHSMQLDLESRRPQVGDRLVDPIECRLGGGQLFVVAAQETDESAHLGHRPPARCLDRAQQLLEAARVVAQQPARGTRLHTHQADMVTYHVVKLAGDPQPLVGHRRGGELVSTDLQLVGPTRQLELVLLAMPGEISHPARKNAVFRRSRNAWNATTAPGTCASASNMVHTTIAVEATTAPARVRSRSRWWQWAPAEKTARNRAIDVTLASGRPITRAVRGRLRRKSSGNITAVRSR